MDGWLFTNPYFFILLLSFQVLSSFHRSFVQLDQVFITYFLTMLNCFPRKSWFEQGLTYRIHEKEFLPSKFSYSIWHKYFDILTYSALKHNELLKSSTQKKSSYPISVIRTIVLPYKGSKNLSFLRSLLFFIIIIILITNLA